MINKKNLYVFRVFQLLYTVFLLVLIMKDLCLDSYDKNAFADLFINYQGGFIRRGLLGELLVQCYHAGFNPITIALIFSFASFIVIAYYIITQFVRRKYELGLLLAGFMLGGFGVYGFGGFRRDFMMLCLFLLIVTLFRKYKNKWVIYGGNLLVSLAILLYEPFVFWGLPLLFLLSLRHFNYIKAMLVWLPSVLVFLICCKFPGGEEVYQQVWQSVSGFLDTPGIIAFLRRPTDEVIHFHLTTNFGTYHHIPTLLISVVSLFSLVYYFVNGIYAFAQSVETKQHRCYLLLTMCFVLFCQLPMFTVLSTDYSRTCIVSTLGSLIFYFSLSTDELNKIFHPRLIRIANKLIDFVDSKITPSPYIIIFLLLFVGVTSWTGSNEGFLGTSELGEIIRVLSRPFRM